MTVEVDHLVQVTAPHFCACLVMRNDKCIAAAPILRWAKRKRREELRAYFADKGWKAVVIQTTTSPNPPPGG